MSEDNKTPTRLNYAAPPPPEPLGRWYVRRFIIFIASIVAALLLIFIVTRVLERLGITIIEFK